MSFRRAFAVVFTLCMLGLPVPARGEGWAWLPMQSQDQQQSSDNSGASAQKMDDSQMRVVQSEPNKDEPIVETANKPKAKKSSSIWNNKIWHPTQWFGSSKSKR